MKKKNRWALAAFLLVTVSAAALADVPARAKAYAERLRQEAMVAVAAAQGRVAGAEQTLRMVRAVEADVRNSRDAVAIQVAREAVVEAERGVREARQLAERANALLARREQQSQDSALLAVSLDRKGGLHGAIFALEGDVQVFDAQGRPVAGRLSLRALQVGDRVVTGKDGSARLILAGGDAEAQLAPGSAMTITEDNLDAGFLADLQAGEARLRAKFLKRWGTRFEVRTPVAVCAVRGTEFSVQADREKVRVAVTEGVVRVTPDAPGAEGLDVNAGEEREWSRADGWGPARSAAGMPRVDWGD